MSNAVAWRENSTDEARPDWLASVPPFEPTAIRDDPRDRIITHNQNVWGGMATVAGSRVPVFMIADLKAEGQTESDIQKRYPHLTLADIYAALSYAHAFEGVITHERAKYQHAVARYRQ